MNIKYIGDDYMDPIKLIGFVKAALADIILKDELKYLKSINSTDLMRIYSADLCGILMSYFPGATIMINSSYKTCATLINGLVYDSSGIRHDLNNFHIANKEEIIFIEKSYNKLPEDIINKIYDYYLNVDENHYVLRKKTRSLT